MITKATYALCLIGAAGSLAIGFGGLGWSLLSVDDALIFPLVTGPYAVLAGLTAWRRSKSKEVVMLLVSAVLVAAYGFWGFGLSLYRLRTTPNAGMAMDLSALTVPAAQWLFTCIVCVIAGVMAAITSRRTQRQSSA